MHRWSHLQERLGLPLDLATWAALLSWLVGVLLSSL